MLRSLARPLSSPAKRVWGGWAQATRALRVLPDFLIIGTQKGGTTSLYNYLIRHPQVLRATTTEVHFFDENYPRGERWYRGHFPTAAYRSLVRRRRGVALTGESSPCYLLDAAAPSRVAGLIPRVKLLVLLRDPVERAYSHYVHRVRRGTETRPFAAVVDEELRLHARGPVPARDADPASGACSYKVRSVLSRGLYLEQLLRWKAHFASEQLLVLSSEEFSRRPGETFARVLSHLGLRPLQVPSQRRYNDFGRPPPMDPAIRRRLADFFDAPNHRLYRHLGRDLGWQCAHAGIALGPEGG